MKNSRLILVALVVALATMLGVAASNGTATPTLYACAGAPAGSPQTMYPEKRVYLEDQVWVDPMPGHTSAEAPEDRTGHLHIGTCFPLYQTLTDPTLHLDIKWQQHNFNPQPVINMTLNAEPDGIVNFRDAGVYNPNDGGMQDYVCQSEQCEGWVSYDVPLSGLASGWRDFNLKMQSFFTDGVNQARNYDEWFANVQNGNPAFVPPVGLEDDGCSDPCNALVRGNGYWSDPAGHPRVYSMMQRKYLERIWNPTTGALVPVSGTLELAHNLGEAQNSRVMVDPAFHAHPPSAGTVVFTGYNAGGYGGWKFYIDTTQLSNGVHRLVLQGTRDRPDGSHASGVLVIPFLVHNEYHPACEANCDQQIATLQAQVSALQAQLADCGTATAALQAKIDAAKVALG